MLISHRKKFIFIHVYKVAGSSVRDALAPYAHSGKWYGMKSKHMFALDVRNRLPMFFDRYFTFAFVRNPYSMEVSLFNFNKKRNAIASKLSFEDFVAERHQNLAVRKTGIQKRFVVDEDGKMIVDFVGRYERLHQDFSYICDRIGFRAGQISQLSHSNRSTFEPWKEFYNSRTRQLVAEMSVQDIEFFGYRFDDGE